MSKDNNNEKQNNKIAFSLFVTICVSFLSLTMKYQSETHPPLNLEKVSPQYGKST